MRSNVTHWKRYLSPHFHVCQIREMGVSWYFKKGVGVLYRLLWRVGTCILYLVILDPILKLLRIEFVYTSQPSRIGHLAADLEHYLKENVVKGRRVRSIILINKGNVANTYLLHLWEQKYTVWHICSKIEELVRMLVTHVASIKYAYVGEAKYEVLSAYSGPPLVTISEEDIVHGDAILRKMGIPDGAWFVCVHNREGEFLPELDYHSYRDGNIENYIEAMRFITAQGGYVVRMGDPTMAMLPPMDHVVDYPHTEWKSAFMDIFLCSRCLFFLGTTAGPVSVARLFDTPICLVNIVPLLAIPINAGTVFIPKLIYSTKENRYLTFAEVVRSDIWQLYRAEDYALRGLVVQENTSEDIVELVREMLEIQTGSVLYSDEDEELQAVFRMVFSDAGRVFRSSARVGRYFIHKYRDLFI